MPELPEVETIKNGLMPVMQGRTITLAETYRADLRTPFPPDFCDVLQGAQIIALTRRSKYLLIHLHTGNIWVVHLGMSGQMLYFEGLTNRKQPHDHVRIVLDGRDTVLYHDPRRFGLMDTIPKKMLTTHPLFAHLGPEPLMDSFTGTVLHAAIHHRKTAIKPTLMNAEIVVGVGNIYASESLFRAGIHPLKSCNILTKKQCELLVECVKQVLGEAIESGGSTLRDYVRSSGDSGYFQHHFAVYDRANQPCPTCQQPIQKVVQQNRSSYFCGKCQK